MSKNKIISDFAWNLIGQAMVILVGVIKNPIYTDLFSPEEFGQYALVETTFQIINIFLFAWIVGCLWRFYNTYHLNINDLKGALSRIFILSNVVNIIICILWVSLAKNDAIQLLILLSALFLPAQQLSAQCFAVMRLEAKPRIYNMYRIVHILGSFLTTIVLAWYYDFSIASIIIGQILFHILNYISIIIYFPEYNFFNLTHLRSKLSKELYKYGITNVVAQLSLILLISSDRYIIALYEDFEKVGIYNQVYNIAQVSIAALSLVMLNTFTPYINAYLTKTKGNKEKITHYIFIFLVLIIPPTFWVSVHSMELSFFLLNERFHEGYSILPFVAISSAVYGVTMFFESTLLYQNKYKTVSGIFIGGIVINLVLNLVLIPAYSYHVAGFTTLFSYCLILIAFYAVCPLSFINVSKKQAILFFNVIFILSLNFISTCFLRRYLTDIHILWQMIIPNFPFLLILGVLIFWYREELNLKELIYK